MIPCGISISTWSSYVVPQARWLRAASLLTCQPRTAQSKCINRAGRSHITFYELALEVTQDHFYHTLWVEAVSQRSTQFKENRL